MNRTAALLVLISIASACESDENKLAQLQSEQVTACLEAQVDSAKVADLQSKTEPTAEYQRRMDAGRSLAVIQDTTAIRADEKAHLARAKRVGLDTLTDQWLAQIRRCDLATRDYNRFMR